MDHNIRPVTADSPILRQCYGSFCPLIMPAGRPRKADPGELYAFAHLFYWDFRRIAEGFTRQKLDQTEYEKVCGEINKKSLRLTLGKQAALEAKAAEEIRNGYLKESKKLKWIRDAKKAWLMTIREDLLRRAEEKATRQLRVAGEPEIIKQLLQAETANEVRVICEDAFPNLPITAGSVLPANLSQYASEFIAARKDPRFPQSTSRPTTRLKQLWFLSRALAGALYDVKTRTAINLIGSKRPEELFEESNSARPVRKGTKVRQESKKNFR